MIWLINTTIHIISQSKSQSYRNQDLLLKDLLEPERRKSTNI